MTSSGPGEKPVERRAAGTRTPTRTRRAAESSPDDGTPQTAAANGVESAPSDDTQELQQQIEQLGETVDQLVAKADVMARAKGKAADLADQVKGQAGQARAQASARAGSVRDEVTSNAAAAGQRAVYVGTAAKDQLVATGGSVWQAAPEPPGRPSRRERPPPASTACRSGWP